MAGKKIKLLIVDDEKDICNFVRLLFKKRGFLVYKALSGVQAVRVAKKMKLDIALLDIHLKKGIDGLEVLRQMKVFLPKCCYVMVTWDKAQEKMKEAKRLGAVSYLTKPLTINQLLTVVNRISRHVRKRG
jgi:DNA-binding response OmpR family regulator